MTIIVTIFSVICTLYTIYFLVVSVGGLLLKPKKIPHTAPKARLAAVIPARNEAAVIGKLVESLLAQDYPRELFDIYVIPNNCDDDTGAVAEAAGAKLLRVDGPIHTKGDVLHDVFAQLSATGKYDAYCVFDADNLVDSKFFGTVNDALASGMQVGQGYRDTKNPFDSWVAGGFTVWFWFLSRFYNESRARLGMSCQLNGTGTMVSDAVIRKIGWNTRTLVEDQEFTALCALNDIKVGWMPDARIYDEQTNDFWTSCVQRRRWTAGSMQCMRRYTLKLLKKHSMACIDMTMMFTGNMMCILSLVPMAGTALGLMPFFIDHPWRILALVLLLGVYYLACCGAAAVLYHFEGKLNLRGVRGVMLFPVFMITWMPVNIVACLAPPPRWHEIRHTRSIDRPDHDAQGN